LIKKKEGLSMVHEYLEYFAFGGEVKNVGEK